MSVKYQNETIQEIRKLTDGTIAAHSAQLGAHENEPLLVCMDALLRYAKAYKRAYDTPIGNDNVLGHGYIKALVGVRILLDGMGAVAMERSISTDSKDNGVIEALYWECCKVAELDGDNL